MLAALAVMSDRLYPITKILYAIVDARPVFGQQPAVSQFLQDRDLEIPDGKRHRHIGRRIGQVH